MHCGGKDCEKQTEWTQFSTDAGEGLFSTDNSDGLFQLYDLNNLANRRFFIFRRDDLTRISIFAPTLLPLDKNSNPVMTAARSWNLQISSGEEIDSIGAFLVVA